MTVDNSAEQADPATMSIYYANNADNVQSESESSENQRVEKINMKGYTNSEILDAFVKVTKAFPVEPTPEDQEELQKLEEQRKRSEEDSKLSQQVRAKVKREQELLRQARGDLASQEG